jgi:hypothetical protein
MNLFVAMTVPGYTQSVCFQYWRHRSNFGYRRNRVDFSFSEWRQSLTRKRDNESRGRQANLFGQFIRPIYSANLSCHVVSR